MEALAAHAASAADSAQAACADSGGDELAASEGALLDALTLLLRALEPAGSGTGSGSHPGGPEGGAAPGRAGTRALPAVLRWAEARRRPRRADRAGAGHALAGPATSADAVLDFRHARPNTHIYVQLPSAGIRHGANLQTRACLPQKVHTHAAPKLAALLFQGSM